MNNNNTAKMCYGIGARVLGLTIACVCKKKMWDIALNSVNWEKIADKQVQRIKAKDSI